MSKLLDDLRVRRNEARARADAILTRAADEGRDLSEEESAEHNERVAEVREVQDRIEDVLEGRVRELSAEPTRAAQHQPVEHRGGHWLASQLQLRGLVGTGTTGGGAFTPAEDANYVFDRLAATSVGLASGFVVLRTTRDSLVVPHWTADMTAAWVAEAGTISSTDATADQVTATPRKVAALQPVSNEALADSQPSLLDAVSTNLVRSLALKMDYAFYEGSGTAPEPRGLKNVANIQTVSMGTNGNPLSDLDPIADAIGALEAENAVAGAIVAHPRTWKSLSKLRELTSGSNKPLLQDSAGSGSQAVQKQVYGVPGYSTSQLSIAETQGSNSDASSIYVYDPSQVYAVFREDTRVEVDSSRLFNSDQSEIRAILRVDLVVANPKAVVRVVGVRP